MTVAPNEGEGGVSPHGPPGLYRRDLWKKAADIKVARLRQILIWPLALRLQPGEGMIDPLATTETLLNDVDGRWMPIPDLLKHAERPTNAHPLAPPPPAPTEGGLDAEASYRADLAQRAAAEPERDRAQSYSEFVYFYDFLQRHLFRPAPDKADPAFRVWRHRDVAGIRFALGWGANALTCTAKIDRLNLYLFSSGALVLVTEIDYGHQPMVAAAGTERHMSLADAQTAVDHLRRAYTPFHYGPNAPAKVPSCVSWLDAKGGAICFPGFNSAEFKPRALAVDMAFVERGGPNGWRTAPLADHWRALLLPLLVAGDSRDDGIKPVWRHVVDERMPAMTYLSLSGASKKLGVPTRLQMDSDAAEQMNDLLIVKRGDWVRLQDANQAGVDELPYSPVFLADFEKEACYDRFWPSPETTMATRYLFSGYHFAGVGAGEFFDSVIVHHFRRHYFQMMLLANMELATLLVTSSRISEAVDALGAQPDQPARDRFVKEIAGIERDLLNYAHRFRFTGVSNQIQPTELYERVRKAMRLNAIFADVEAELNTAVQFNATLQLLRQSDAAIDLAESGERLAVIAVIAFPLGLALTAVDVEPIAHWAARNPFHIGQNLLWTWSDSFWRFVWIFGLTGVFGLLTLGVLRWLRRASNNGDGAASARGDSGTGVAVSTSARAGRPEPSPELQVVRRPAQRVTLVAFVLALVSFAAAFIAGQ